jgi:hypothetical protein
MSQNDFLHPKMTFCDPHAKFTSISLPYFFLSIEFVYFILLIAHAVSPKTSFLRLVLFNTF